MSCQLGQLYNKDVIITPLVKQKNVTCDEKNHVINSSVVGHIRTLKDVRELNLTRNPVHSSQKQGAPARDGTYVAKHISEFICLIFGLEINGFNAFFYMIGKRDMHFRNVATK